MSSNEDTPSGPEADQVLPAEGDPQCPLAPPDTATRKLVLPCELHSEYENGPFKTCSVCSKGLLEAQAYGVQKVYRGKEVIFEMAICQTCAEQTSKEFSRESMDALKGFLLSTFKPSAEISHCHFCGFPRHFVANFTLEAVCQGQTLLAPAMVLCERCSDHLQSRLSKKTRDAQEGFIRDNFPGIPADMDFSPALGGIL